MSSIRDLENSLDNLNNTGGVLDDLAPFDVPDRVNAQPEPRAYNRLQHEEQPQENRRNDVHDAEHPVPVADNNGNTVKAEGAGKNLKYVADGNGAYDLKTQDKKKRFLEVMNTKHARAIRLYKSLGAGAPSTTNTPNAVDRAIGRNAKKIGAFSNTMTAMSNYQDATNLVSGTPITDNKVPDFFTIASLVKGLLGCVLLSKKLADTANAKDAFGFATTLTKLLASAASLGASISMMFKNVDAVEVKKYTNFVLPIINGIDVIENVGKAIILKLQSKKYKAALDKVPANQKPASSEKLLAETNRQFRLSITNAALAATNAIPRVLYAIKFFKNPEDENIGKSKAFAGIVGLGVDLAKTGIGAFSTSKFGAGEKPAAIKGAIDDLAALGNAEFNINSSASVNADATNQVTNTLNAYEMNAANLDLLGANYASIEKSANKADLLAIISRTISPA